jgi:hypothetical protein
MMTRKKFRYGVTIQGEDSSVVDAVVECFWSPEKSNTLEGIGRTACGEAYSRSGGKVRYAPVSEAVLLED